MTQGTAARRLLDAITGRDFAAVEAVLASDARMRALLPSELVEAIGPQAIVERFRAWFGEADPFEMLSAAVEPVADRSMLRYRLRLRRPGASEETVIEQHVVCAASNGAVDALDLLCTGFRPVSATGGAAARDFDAGSLGCADGLVSEFKQRIREVGVGDLLRVHTVDPSAKEDLPSLARLMGHVVRSVEDHSDGGLTITVERGR